MLWNATEQQKRISFCPTQQYKCISQIPIRKLELHNSIYIKFKEAKLTCGNRHKNNGYIWGPVDYEGA